MGVVLSETHLFRFHNNCLSGRALVKIILAASHSASLHPGLLKPDSGNQKITKKTPKPVHSDQLEPRMENCPRGALVPAIIRPVICYTLIARYYLL